MNQTAIVRHRRENLKKCSLRGLEQRSDLQFYTYPINPLPDFSGYLVLKVGAPVLSSADRDRNLLLIDGTWRLASIMEKQLPPHLEARSLPQGWKTAYPRRQTDCPDPEAGLASIEALYIAYLVLGKPTEGLLDGYYWKETFLEKNDHVHLSTKKSVRAAAEDHRKDVLREHFDELNKTYKNVMQNLTDL